MIFGALKSAWLARLLLLIGVLMLIVGPTRAVAADAMESCCASSPCHEDGKARCIDTCVLACQAMVAPSVADISPSLPMALAATALPPGLLAGLAVTPELPPPR